MPCVRCLTVPLNYDKATHIKVSIQLGHSKFTRLYGILYMERKGTQAVGFE